MSADILEFMEAKNLCNIEKVLDKFCPPVQIRWWRLTDHKSVVEALDNGRSIITSFDLTKEQFTHMINFFKKCPEGTLFELPPSGIQSKVEQAFILIKCIDDTFVFKSRKNSDEVFSMSLKLGDFMKFYDVIYFADDLTDEDRVNYFKVSPA